MTSKMLIDAAHPEETRVVVVKGNRVEEFDFEAQSRKQLRGSIYLAKVTRVEPSLQAAFVDYGGNRHGFLAFSEIHPDYYQIPAADRQALLEEEEKDEIAAAAEEASEDESSGKKRRGRKRVKPLKTDDETAPDDASEAVAADEQAGANASDDGSDTPSDEDMPNGDAVPLEAAPDDMVSEDADTGAEDSADNSAAEEEPTAFGTLDGNEAEVTARYEADSDQDDDDDAVDSVGDEDAMEEVPQRKPQRKRNYKIQEVIKRRQVLLVQVVKEERGNKGAALTTYLSMAGRYCVLMPNTARGGGISRKITNAEDRKRLKDIARELEVPKGMGVILRTAGASRTKAEIRRDFEYLLRLWEAVRTLTLESMAPSLVYEEGNIVKRAIRDIYSREIGEVLVAGDGAYKEAREFMRMLMPSHAKNIHLYKYEDPIFSHFDVEQQLDAMFSAQVTLRSGGYIVLNQTEALVAIDVNSGRATKEHSIEDTALRTNLEAAEEIARQLRLRDLAGLVVIDFIDMEENRNNRAIERKLKECLKTDRARIQVGRISHFGLIEMSRQRIRPGIMEGSFITCPHCAGLGVIRSSESVALQVVRSIEDAQRNRAVNVTVRARPDAALYILNNKRGHLWDLEQRYGIAVTILADNPPGDEPFVIETGAPGSQPPRPRKASNVITVEDAAEDDSQDTRARPTDDDNDASGEDGHQRRRRRGRRGGRRRRGGNIAVPENEIDENEVEAAKATETDGDASLPTTDAKAETATAETAGHGDGEATQSDDRPKRPRKTGRRRVSKKASEDAAQDQSDVADTQQDAEGTSATSDEDTTSADHGETASSTNGADTAASAEGEVDTDEPPSPSADTSPAEDKDAEPESEAQAAAEAETPETRRKGWWQRTLGSSDN